MITACLAFALGALVGALALARWYFSRMRRQDVAIDLLKGAYRVSHGHWLQVSKDDDTPVCPCCGFSESRRKEAVVEHLREVAKAP